MMNGFCVFSQQLLYHVMMMMTMTANEFYAYSPLPQQQQLLHHQKGPMIRIAVIQQDLLQIFLCRVYHYQILKCAERS